MSETQNYTVPTIKSTKTTEDTESQISQFYYDYSERYRWILGTSIIVLTILIGPTVLNYPPLRNMISDSGAYRYLCKPNELVCDAQQTALQNLGGFIQSIYFCFSVIAGALLDFLGAKVCAATGFTLNIAGWLLVAFSGVNFDGYKPGLVFVAISIDFMFFGIMSICNLFPGYTSTFLALLGSARSITFAIPLLMESAYTNTSLGLMGVCIIFVVVQALLLVLTLIFIPFKSYPKLPPNAKLDYISGENKIATSKFVNQKPSFTFENLKNNAQKQFRGGAGFILEPSYLAFLAVMIVALIRNTYYTETTPTHLKSAETYYSIINPLSFIPCPLLGYLSDKVSAALTCGIIAICGVLSMVCLLFKTTAFEYISATINWVYISFIASQCYCYIAFVYPQDQMGKLAGFCFLVAGLFSFFSSSMNNFTKVNDLNLMIMDFIVVVLGLIAIGLTLILYIYKEKPIRSQHRKDKIALETGSKYSDDFGV